MQIIYNITIDDLKFLVSFLMGLLFPGGLQLQQDYRDEQTMRLKMFGTPT